MTERKQRGLFKGFGVGRIDQGLIRDLASLLSETELTEIEVERQGYRIRVSRQATAASVSAPVSASAAMPTPAAPATAPAAPSPAGGDGEVAAPDLSRHPGLVASPMVGTVYVAPQPGAAPFVKLGDTVSEGQTLIIIEAMKTMNPIPAPRAGKVMQILVRDGQPVEYGEPLLVIE